VRSLLPLGHALHMEHSRLSAMPRGGRAVALRGAAMKLDPAAMELVSIEGEMALLIRLGRRATDPVPELGRVTRSFKVKEPAPDSLGPFLAEATMSRAGARARARPLYDSYRAWCEAHGAKPASLVGFHRAMKARGYRQVVSNGHWWLDVSVVETQSLGPLL
jgi:hypothetical protein